MPFTIPDLIALIDLDTLEPDRFRGTSPQTGWHRIFGGLVIAQSLVAASRTVEAERTPHALHGLFLRPGDPAVPIDFAVTRLRDGRSFAARHCLALQHGVPIFTLTASFQAAEDGFEHQIAMPDVPPPEALPDEADLLARFGASLAPGVRRYLERERPIELRPVSLDRFTSAPGASALPVQQVWIRAKQALPADPAIHRAVLAYLSDMTLLETALIAHNRSLLEPGLQVASLDHALWFHRPARVDAWLLYAQDSPSASGARGLARGNLFARDGTLIASVAQEGLIRERPPRLDAMPKK